MVSAVVATVGIGSSRTTAADAGTLGFQFGSFETYEDVGELVIYVTRSGGEDGPIDASCQAQNAEHGDNKATAGKDFGTQLTSLHWDDGEETPQRCAIKILNDSIVEPPEHFLIVVGAEHEEQPALRAQRSVVIYDDENAGAASFTSGVGTGEGILTGLWIRRLQGSTGAVSVSWETYRISNPGEFDSATPGQDYVHASGTVTWADRDFAEHMVFISLVPDCKPEDTEVFGVRLTTTTGGLQLGSPSAVQVTISDDDENGPSPGCVAGPPASQPTSNPPTATPQSKTPTAIPTTPAPAQITSTGTPSATVTPTPTQAPALKFKVRSPSLSKD